jgi:hypothetical protein
MTPFLKSSRSRANGARARTIAICLAGLAAALATAPSWAASAPRAPMFGSSEAVAPAEALPAPGGAAQPFRKTATGACANNWCVATITKVPTGKQLQIETVTCAGYQPNGGFRIFYLTTKQQSNSAQEVVQNLRAIIPAPHIGGPGYDDYPHGTGSGPIFFKAGERVFITSDGTGSTCTVSGYLLSLQ